MKFLADMGVPHRVAGWLQTLGHEVFQLRDHGMERMVDAAIFEMAATEGRVILTFDLDFGEILAKSGNRVVSVILFRLSNTRSSFVIERLGAVLASSAEALEKGAVVVVEDGRHRIRRLPLGQ